MDPKVESRYRNIFGGTQEDKFIISDNRCLGLLTSFDPDRFFEIGRMRLTSKPHGMTKMFDNLYLNMEYLYLALKVFRRRRIFTYGFYNLGLGWVHCIKEKDDYIVIAPAFFEDGEPRKYPDFSEVTKCRFYEYRIRGFQTWRKILGQK
jgi:hypothetical protein